MVIEAVVSPTSQISFLFALRPIIFEYRRHWDKCTKWPQNDLKHYKVKGTWYMFCSWVPILICFALRTAMIFELQAISRKLHQMTPNDLEHDKVKGTFVLHICSISNPPYHIPTPHPVPNVNPFPSTASHIRGACYVKTNAKNDSKITQIELGKVMGMPYMFYWCQFHYVSLYD